MDEIINLFEKIIIKNIQNENKSENEIESLIDKFNESNIIDQEKEWNLLQENYSKLKYLNKLIKNNQVKTNKDFIKPFTNFINKIIKTNIYYVDHICLNPRKYTKKEGFNNLDIQSVRELISQIAEDLDRSIQDNDPFIKLEYTLSAYKYMIDIAEDIRSEKAKEIIPNEFVEEFKHKRRN
jgi:hypothetical protein